MAEGRDVTRTDTRSRSSEEARSDVCERRRRLRDLDVVLGEEFVDAGALSFVELRGHVADRELLGRQISDATLWEWWSYAQRRAFIEPRPLPGSEAFTLTASARTDVADRRFQSSMQVAPAMRKVLRDATPAGWLSLVFSAAALASTGSTGWAVLTFVACAVIAALVVPPLVDLLLGRRADARLDRRILARQVSWLEGDALSPWFGKRAQPGVDAGKMRRLESPPLPVLPEEAAIVSRVGDREVSGATARQQL